MGMKNFEPAFFLEHLDDMQRVVLVGQGGDLMTDGAAENMIDVLAFFCGVVAGLRALFERPVKTGGEARGATPPPR